MILSSEQTVRAVRTILEEQVLPLLETADWTASNVRACLLLLTYAEDCIRLERPLLTETNAAMLDLFRSTLQRTDLPWVDAELLAALNSTVKSMAAAPADEALASLAATNTAGKTLLSDLVCRAADARATTPSPADASFRAELHRCLAVLKLNDAKLTTRTRTMLPI